MMNLADWAQTVERYTEDLATLGSGYVADASVIPYNPHVTLTPSIYPNSGTSIQPPSQTITVGSSIPVGQTIQVSETILPNGYEWDLSPMDWDYDDVYVAEPHAQPVPLTPMRSVDTLRSLVAAGVVSVDDLREVLAELGIAPVAPIEAQAVRGIRIREEVH